MDIKKYIDGGAIEAYVLGLASEADRKEFELLCLQHPELVEARIAFETALEEQMIQGAIPVPGHLKAPIMKAVYSPALLQKAQSRTVVRNIPRRLTIWRLATAASLILAVATIYFNYNLKNKNKELLAVTRSLDSQIQRQASNPIIASDSLVRKSSVRWSLMFGEKDPSHCMAHIYWDTSSNRTYLLIGNIPTPLLNREFQLWAMVDNQPVNLGIFDVTKQGSLLAMRPVTGADGFMITLEQRGGSPRPTMDAIYATARMQTN